MIRVSIELHPGGDASRARQIARLDIAGVSGSAPLGDYAVRASSVGGWAGQPAFETDGLTVVHRRKDSIWMLLAAAAARAAAAWTAATAEEDEGFEPGAARRAAKTADARSGRRRRRNGARR